MGKVVNTTTNLEDQVILRAVYSSYRYSLHIRSDILSLTFDTRTPLWKAAELVLACPDILFPQ